MLIILEQFRRIRRADSERLRRRVAVAVAFMLSALNLSSVPIPQLSLAGLEKLSDIVVVGEVLSVVEAGKDVLEFQSTSVPVRIEHVSVRIDKVFKGTASEKILSIRMSVPELPVGYRSVALGDYRVFFLKQRGLNEYEFTSPYYPSVVAPRGMIAVEDTPIGQVVATLAGVLGCSSCTVEQKREAIVELRGVRDRQVDHALRELLAKNPDPALTMDILAELVARNDISVLPRAVGELTHPTLEVPEYLRHNLAFAISQLRNEKAIPSLSHLLTAADPEVRRSAASALRDIGSKSAISPLSKALEDRDFEVRYLAVIGLAEITNQSEWRPLEETFRASEQRYLSYWKAWAKQN